MWHVQRIVAQPARPLEGLRANYCARTAPALRPSKWQVRVHHEYQLPMRTKASLRSHFRFQVERQYPIEASPIVRH